MVANTESAAEKPLAINKLPLLELVQFKLFGHKY